MDMKIILPEWVTKFFLIHVFSKKDFTFSCY